MVTKVFRFIPGRLGYMFFEAASKDLNHNTLPFNMFFGN